MKLKAIVTALALSAIAAPALAGDVDIYIGQGMAGVGQINLAGVGTDEGVVLDQTNAGDIVSIAGEKVEDVVVSQSAAGVLQGNASLVLAAKAVEETQANVLNVTSVDVTTKDWSDISVYQSAAGVLQGNLALIGAGKAVDLSQVNATNIVDVSVNVTP